MIAGNETQANCRRSLEDLRDYKLGARELRQRLAFEAMKVKQTTKGSNNMDSYLRRVVITILLFTSFGIAAESVQAGTAQLGTVARYETSSDFISGISTPLDPPDKVYIYDYAVESRALLFGGVDGETVTLRYVRPDGISIDAVSEYDARKGCWKDGKSCALTGDGWTGAQLFLAGFPREVLGVWTYDLLNNGALVYTENFTLVTPELSIAGGNGQDAPPSQLIPEKLEVRLVDDDGVTPLIGRGVQFVISDSPRIGNNDTAAFLTANGTGTGSQSSSAATDSQGYAHVYLHLGSVLGSYQVTATSSKAPLDVLVFTATAKDPTAEEADDDRENGDPDCAEGAGDPINLITGNVYQLETDLAAVAPALLKFERHYNSRDPLAGDMGWNWRHTYDRSIAMVTTGSGPSATTTAYVRRPDGKRYAYVDNSGVWTTDPDVHHTLTQDASGWTFRKDNTSERFDPDGKLTSITNIAGRTIQLTYSTTTGLLQSVDDDMGSWLQFTHNADGRVETVTDQALRTWRYSYDVEGNLTGVENPDLTTRQYHYENVSYPNALTGITDERGIRYSTWEYNADGLATANYLAGNVERVDVDYLPAGLLTVLNSRNNSSSYQTRVRYGSGKVTQISGPACSSCAAADSNYVYDASNNLVEITREGVTTRFGGYGSSAYPGYSVESPGTMNERRTDFSYDSRFHGLATKVIEPSVTEVFGWYHVTQNTYDDFGNVIKIVENGFTPGLVPESVALTPREMTFSYNGPLGQLSLADGLRTDVSDTLTFEYYPNDVAEGNNRARLKRVTNALGQIVRDNIQYTAAGLIQSERHRNGFMISYSYYPGNNRLQTATESNGVVSRTMRWTYLPTGEVTSVTPGDGSFDATPLFFDYDDARRLTAIRDGLGNQRKFVLNTEGGIESEQLYDPALVLHKATGTVFDTYERLQTRTIANESITRSYNLDSSLATETNGKGVVTTFAYDDLKRLTSTTATVEGVVKTVITDYYNDADGTTAVTPPATQATSYETDDFGHLLAVSSPGTGLATTIYDAFGNVSRRQDSSNQVFVYQYDALNRRLSIDAPGTADDVDYTYDTCLNGVGRLCSVIMESGAILYTYDGFGNVTSNQNTSITYDAVGRRKSITYPSGSVVGYSYDASGELVSLELNNVSLISSIMHAPFGPTTGWLFGNGQNYVATYDAAYRLTLQQTVGVLDRAYDSYDGNGNLLQMTETVAGVPTINFFGYTDDNRLASASGVFGTRGYSYSPNGNRESLDDGTEVLPFYNTNDRLHTIGDRPQVTGGGGETPEELIPGTSINEDFAYDARGNRTTRIENDWTCVATVTPDPGTGRDITTYECTESVIRNWVYTYTSLNRLKSVSLDGVAVGSYEYNGLGQRIKKTLSDGTVTQYVYDQDGSLLAELNDVGTALREYIYIDGAPVAMRDLSTGVEKVFYIHTDHLGTPKAMTNNVGTVVWRASHDPFGAATVDEDPDGDTVAVALNIRFPGQYYDDEAGLHYNYFRTYDPSIGRYLESDPIGLRGGLNTYAYVGGNPLRFTDPFGLEVIYNDNTVLNAQVRDNLSRLDQALPGHDIVVTGGDRFRESDGSIRSASNGSIVDGASETSPHLYDRGARAADIAVPGATQQQIADAVNSTDFSTANTAHYDDGHTHVALPPFQSQNIRPEIREAFCAQNPRAAGCVPPPTDCP